MRDVCKLLMYLIKAHCVNLLCSLKAFKLTKQYDTNVCQAETAAKYPAHDRRHD